MLPFPFQLLRHLIRPCMHTLRSSAIGCSQYSQSQTGTCLQGVLPLKPLFFPVPGTPNSMKDVTHR